MSPKNTQRRRALLDQARRQGQLDDPTFAFLELIEEGYQDSRREILFVNRFVRVILYTLVALVAVIALVASLSFWRQDDLTKQTRALAEKNAIAIRVGCTLLSNAIIQSGGADTQPGQRPTPQSQLTAHYIHVIHRVQTPGERRKESDLLKLAAKAGPVITVPDCRQVAQHPDTVTALPLRIRRP